MVRPRPKLTTRMARTLTPLVIELTARYPRKGHHRNDHAAKGTLIGDALISLSALHSHRTDRAGSRRFTNLGAAYKPRID